MSVADIDLTTCTPKLYQLLQNYDAAELWAELAQTELDWYRFPKKILAQTDQGWRWFDDGTINITVNCLDRHVVQNPDKIALIFTDETGEVALLSYQSLLTRVNQTAQFLKSLGVSKGDRVVTYLPLCEAQAITMLACARIGAVHSVVYAGYAAEALHERIEDAGARVVVATPATVKNGKTIDLWPVIEQAVEQSSTLEHVVVFRPDETTTKKLKDIVFHDWSETQLGQFSNALKPEVCQANDPLFILYTSGTTAKPKGIVHGHGGYNLYTHTTAKINFKLHPESVLFSTADAGWITGHSYTLYGALSNGVTSIWYEGSPLAQNAEVYWQIVEKYQVSALYTAPTIIRLLMKENASGFQKYNISSLEVLGSVGEPLNPSAWEWLSAEVGAGNIPVIDTWWQTETGGHVVGGMPDMPQSPGVTGFPNLGQQLAVVNEVGEPVEIGKKGMLVITKPWPGMLLDCWNNHDRYLQYFNHYQGHDYFYTGDMAVAHDDGRFTIVGRTDDVLNVGGVRIGSAEVENVLVAHPSVAEAAVVADVDPLKGEKIVAHIILHDGFEGDESLRTQLRQHVKDRFLPTARPDTIIFVDSLPKTRSGKIQRRLLRNH